MENFSANETIFNTILFQSRLSEKACSFEDFESMVLELKKSNEALESFIKDKKQEDLEVFETGDVNNFRPRNIGKSFSQNELKSLTKEFMDGYFRVPKVMD